MKRNNRKRWFLSLVVCTFAFQAKMFGINYLGLREYVGGEYSSLTSSQIHDDTLYVPTSKGLFAKSLKVAADTLWDLRAFDGVPVLDFDLWSDTLVGLLYSGHSQLVVSTNRGDSYSVVDAFPETDFWCSSFAVNPRNHSSLMINGYVSYDFGKSWIPSGPSRAIRVFGFHPLDTVVAYASIIDTYLENAYLSVRCESNGVWRDSKQGIGGQNSFVYHPVKPNVMLGWYRGGIWKTTDFGSSWQRTSTPEGVSGQESWKITQDALDPSCFYAVGPFSQEGYPVIRSEDEGETWTVLTLFTQDLLGCGVSDDNPFRFIEVNKWKDLLIFHTTYGIYALDLNSLVGIPAIRNDSLPDVSISFVNNRIVCTSRQPIRHVLVTDLEGRRVRFVQPGFATMDVVISDLPVGRYVVTASTASESRSRKLFVQSN